MTRFDFYLSNYSFKKPENLSVDTLREKVEHLSKDCEFIRSYEEKIYRHPSIYEEKFIDDWDLVNMHNPEFVELIGRDHQFMLQIIIDQSIHTDIENELVIKLLDDHSSTNVNGLLCLHEINDIDTTFCIYTKNDWFQFHRYFLGLYPIDEEYYASRCEIYFPRLHFHYNISNTLKSLEGGLSNFSQKITFCLTKLNDDFSLCFNPSNIVDSLREFTSICGYETTNEGNIKRKEDLTFDFVDNEGNQESIYCEPHIKLSKSDNKGDTHYYFNRIYFHVGGYPNVANGNSMIGHIGNHL